MTPETIATAVRDGATITKSASAFTLVDVEGKTIAPVAPDHIRILRREHVIIPTQGGRVYKQYHIGIEENRILQAKIQDFLSQGHTPQQAIRLANGWSLKIAGSRTHNRAGDPHIKSLRNLDNFIRMSLDVFPFIEGPPPKIKFTEMYEIYALWTWKVKLPDYERIGRKTLYASLMDSGIEARRYMGYWYFIKVQRRLGP